MRIPWAIALVILLAGCAQPPAGRDGPDASASPAPSVAPPAPRPSASPAPPTPTGPPASPQPPPPGAAPNRTWVEPEAAAIRPGAALGGGSCTANFVFTSPDNGTVYLGTAAHCFSDDLAVETDGCAARVHELNRSVEVQGAQHPATLAYSSWSAMQAAGESDPEICLGNDFALLRLHPEDAALTSPALWRFGGPTALADGGFGAGDTVLSYGNSGTRPQDSPLSPREGYVASPGAFCDTRVVFANPAVPGDSGSPVLLGDGRALGLFASIELLPLPGVGHVCRLDGLLAYAAGHGAEVRLATWDLLQPGILPPLR